jgi:FkbM family methyltransferase
MLQNIWRYVAGTIRFYLSDLGLVQFLRILLAPKGTTLSVRLPNIPHEITIRPTKPDVLVLWQTFGLQQCRLTLSTPAKLIVDAGANIGCTAVFFANVYPTATIIAVEPHTDNVALAEKNCYLYPNVQIVQGAVWHEPKMLEIENPTGESWAFRMRERCLKETSEGIRGYTIDELSRGANIDILKVDIEGGEKQLFGKQTSWLSRVGTMLVEVHGKECRDTVKRASLQARFQRLPPQGEYLVFARRC